MAATIDNRGKMMSLPRHISRHSLNLLRLLRGLSRLRYKIFYAFVGIFFISNVYLFGVLLGTTLFEYEAGAHHISITSHAVDHALTSAIVAAPLGFHDAHNSSDWVVTLCPEVVNHFHKFPTFTNHTIPPHTRSALMNAKAATNAVCTLKLFKALVASLGHHVYLHAGAHLGAVLHGQHIPWDDDLDLFLNHRFHDEVANACKKLPPVYPGCHMKCYQMRKTNIKVWVDDGRPLIRGPNSNWNSPYLDVFAFKIENNLIYELSPDPPQPFSTRLYFPTRPYYFGGVYAMGPHHAIALMRYNKDICRTSGWNHMKERRHERWFRNKVLDCQLLATKFPFVRTSLQGVIGIYMNGQKEQSLVPETAYSITSVTNPSETERAGWFIAKDDQGQKLTGEVPHLNTVEINNSLSPHDECRAPDGEIKVVEYNAERGRWWLEAINILDEIKADIIILNEMDIGMARSGQQHTTRLMAHHLKMNYIFGIEFVELTLGTKEEQAEHREETNFHGLHGNAILTRCQISDGKIFRDKIGDYFSRKSNGVNAGGYEKRIGGRMGLFGRILVEGHDVVVGSVHKVRSQDKPIREYINQTKAVVAGDQGSKSCAKWGLGKIGEKEYTWPASCDSLGSQRGDNICSNMGSPKNKIGMNSVIKPCVTVGSIHTQIGDHAILKSTLII